MLVSGWTIATSSQPPSFDSVTDTVSALAASDAADRWVMTLTFLLVGCYDVITGLALRPAGAVGRLILVAGSAAGTLVAVNPQPPGGGPLPHATWASVGFVALAAWPGGAWRRGPSVPWALRPAVCAGAVAVLLALLAWFGAELVTGAGQAGLAELVLGVAQAVWPLMVVLSCRRPVRTAAGSPIYTASTSERRRPVQSMASRPESMHSIIRGPPDRAAGRRTRRTRFRSPGHSSGCAADFRFHRLGLRVYEFARWPEDDVTSSPGRTDRRCSGRPGSRHRCRCSPGGRGSGAGSGDGRRAGAPRRRRGPSAGRAMSSAGAGCARSQHSSRGEEANRPRHRRSAVRAGCRQDR